MNLDAAASITRAAQLLERAAGRAAAANELEVPRLLFRGRAITQMEQLYREAVTNGRRALVELQGIDGPAADALHGVDELLAKIDPDIARDKHQPLWWLRSYSETRDVAGRLGMRGDRLRLLAAQVDGDPAIIRARLDADVRAITTKPFDQVTREDVRRLAAIDGMPESVRPNLPPRLRDTYGPEELVLRRMLPGSDNIARGEFEMYRLAAAREAIEADPTATRAALDAEARAIITTPNADVTAEQVARLSELAGLGDQLRPAILDTPVPWPQHRLAELSAWGWTPARNGEAKAKFAALRMALEHEAMRSDPALTKQAVTTELVELLATPAHELTDQQLYRASQLARLPEHLRPPLPAPIDNHYRFENLGLLGYHPANHRAAAATWDRARVHMAAVVDPEYTVRQLAARVQAGEQVDFRVIDALADQDELLHAHGLTTDVLNRLAVSSLADAGLGSTGELRVLLERMRDRFRAIPETNTTLADVRRSTLELLDANIDRMLGRRTDTYSRHPDYAEVGRIVSSAKLVDTLSTPASKPRPAASTMADATTAATDTLSW